jgi:hypothetical protein
VLFVFIVGLVSAFLPFGVAGMSLCLRNATSRIFGWILALAFV